MCLLEVILEIAAVQLEEFDAINFHGITSENLLGVFHSDCGRGNRHLNSAIEKRV
jgi:hypothetical protein